jgi:hypothetical protein
MQPKAPQKMIQYRLEKDERKVIKTPAGTVIPKFKPRPDPAAAWLKNEVIK